MSLSYCWSAFVFFLLFLHPKGRLWLAWNVFLGVKLERSASLRTRSPMHHCSRKEGCRWHVSYRSHWQNIGGLQVTKPIFFFYLINNSPTPRFEMNWPWLISCSAVSVSKTNFWVIFAATGLIVYNGSDSHHDCFLSASDSCQKTSLGDCSLSLPSGWIATHQF